jgi:hypothetical protein
MRAQFPAVPVLRRRAPRAALLLLAANLAVACDDPTGFSPVLATYVARTVNGAPIPGPLLQNPNYELLVVADTLRFGPFGDAEWTRVRRTTVAGVAQEVEIARTEYSYRIRGDSVLFVVQCPPDADCAPWPRGVFSSDRRHLVVQLELPEAVLEYEQTNP